MSRRAADLKVWAAALVAAVSAAIAVAIIGIALDAGMAQAATRTRATIEATEFTFAGQTGEAFAVCPGTKRALGGGVVQSGPASGLVVQASGPLDATGVTLNTNDGDKAKQWYAAVFNGNAQQRTLRVFAICE